MHFGTCHTNVCNNLLALMGPEQVTNVKNSFHTHYYKSKKSYTFIEAFVQF